MGGEGGRVRSWPRWVRPAGDSGSGAVEHSEAVQVITGVASEGRFSARASARRCMPGRLAA